jgi:predicted RNA-binding Zn ribbon-like protein
VDDAGVPVLRPDTGHLDGPVAVVEARILAALPVAAVDGTLARLKVCANPDCEWAFYDTSRSRSGTWCVMNVCGARHKMSRYRSRQRESADGGDGVDL